MQRASSETIVLDAERRFEPSISWPQLSALPAELWRPPEQLVLPVFGLQEAKKRVLIVLGLLETEQLFLHILGFLEA